MQINVPVGASTNTWCQKEMGREGLGVLTWKDSWGLIEMWEKKMFK